MIAFVTILVSAATVVIGAPLQDEPEPNIIGGKPTTIEKHPHQVIVLNPQNLSCGGTIINENHVVTALHCIHDPELRGQEKKYQVLVGVTDQTKDKGELFDVEKISEFSDPLGRFFSGDVAVLKLTRNITFGRKAQPIALVLPNREPQPGENLTVTGWGALSDPGRPSGVLHEVKVDAISWRECQEKYVGILWELTEYMTCAGDGVVGFALGDFGCGLVNDKNQLVGIVSWSLNFAEPGHPGVYTDVANPDIQEFIVQHSKK